MAETNVGNFLSPEAVIMLPIAVTLDVASIVLVCFALDDFFITDIIGWGTLGIWSVFRSQIKGGNTTAEMPNREGRKEQIQQIQSQKETEATKTGKATKTTRAARWARWIRFLEFVPYLGVLPFWTISTFFILKED